MSQKIEATKKKRVFLLEDHRVVRQGLKLFIAQEPDLEVCGEADNAPQALAAVSKLKPDAVISDISLPGTNGIEFLKDMKVRHPEIVTIVLSMHDDSLYAERALRAGARGYVMKTESTEEVVAALRTALKGGYHVSDKVTGVIFHKALGAQEGVRSGPASPVSILSDRELEIFELIGRGQSTTTIASTLRLSPKTVETHRVHIKTKLQIKTVAELVRHAALWLEHASAH